MRLPKPSSFLTCPVPLTRSKLLTRAILLTVILGTTVLWMTPVRSRAQVISLKTVPVATGDQFLLLPSERLGMGGMSIALDDMLLDPFVNPAKGALISESVLLGTPTFYGISNASGAGRSLPVSALFRSNRGFGAISFALQQLESGQQQDVIFFATDVFWAGPQQRLSESSATNLYLNGSVGRELGDSGFSVGAGVSWAGLNALDGVEHLYALSNGIDQSGHQADFRAGLFWDRREEHHLPIRPDPGPPAGPGKFGRCRQPRRLWIPAMAALRGYILGGGPS